MNFTCYLCKTLCQVLSCSNVVKETTLHSASPAWTKGASVPCSQSPPNCAVAGRICWESRRQACWGDGTWKQPAGAQFGKISDAKWSFLGGTVNSVHTGDGSRHTPDPIHEPGYAEGYCKTKSYWRLISSTLWFFPSVRKWEKLQINQTGFNVL